MSSTLDKIIEEVHTLAHEEQQQLLGILEYETHNSEQSRCAALSKSIRGKYAHLGVSSDNFAARKAEEIALEDRHSAARACPELCVSDRH
jgi:hypothetical protein